MLTLTFSGWFQCRLATNPDPSDERRGVSGYTFALGKEPDLDRIIRLHDPVAMRSHGPEVGVFVRHVEVRGTPFDDHPLLGARFDLLDAPRFESRNRVLSDDRAGTGPIHPFHVEIAGETAGGAVLVRRKDLLEVESPGRPLHEAGAEALNRRAPIHLDGFRLDDERFREATGASDPGAYRRRRRALLEEDLEQEADSLAAAMLRKRIRELSVTDPYDQRVLMLRATQTRTFGLRGPVEVEGPPEELDLDGEAPWPIAFWMGAWDADALSGFMQGTLRIPLR